MNVPLIDQRHDFNRAGRIDRPRVRLRAARWAYSLLDGWRFGPFAVLAVETTGHLDKEAEIVQLGLVNETGRTLLDTLVRPLKESLPQAAAQHGITNDRVAGAPSFGKLYPHLKRFLRGRALVVYDWERQDRLLREAMRHCSSGWQGIHLQDLGEQVAYFYGIVHEDGWPVERVSLGNACRHHGQPGHSGLQKKRRQRTLRRPRDDADFSQRLKGKKRAAARSSGRSPLQTMASPHGCWNAST